MHNDNTNSTHSKAIQTPPKSEQSALEGQFEPHAVSPLFFSNFCHAVSPSFFQTFVLLTKDKLQVLKKKKN